MYWIKKNLWVHIDNIFKNFKGDYDRKQVVNTERMIKLGHHHFATSLAITNNCTSQCILKY